MQISRSGDLVRVRQQRWRIAEVRAHSRCRELALVGAGATNVGIEQRFLEPFDIVEPLAKAVRLRWVRTPAWRQACRTWLAESGPPGPLRAAHLARIELRPHQLEPVLAVTAGRGCRLLLADSVGLGKTIQAGLILRELLACNVATRALVLTPSGLRDQWQSELADRFGLHADVIDASAVRSRLGDLPFGVNPWSTMPIAIASVDYVKRTEVLPAVIACRWDVLIVDEAHAAAGQTDRRAAVAGLASRALYVLLLSATPHNGNRHQFQQLCGLGAHGDPLLVFRRSRQDVPVGAGRRIHRLFVHMGPSEGRMHGLLDAFGRAVRRQADSGREMWLALATLHKRALSCPLALRRSVERRIATLCGAPADGIGQQLDLPWTDPSGESTPDDAPPDWPAVLSLGGGARERSLLERLARAAADAVAEDSKLRALVRLLNRIGEPAIVFTEYRDTLAHLERSLARPAILLHGGLARAERNRALEAFARGSVPVLLATDAAAEGLNLQQRCRIVVNLELPWNPMRLEQRIGRVDRIGQSRRVHVFHLIARGTGEDRLLHRLRAKIDRARLDLGAVDPIDGDEASAARFVIGGISGEGPLEGAPSADGIQSVPRDAFEHLAHVEAARLERARVLLRSTRRLTAPTGPPGPWLARSRHRDTRAALRGRWLAVYRVAFEDGGGRTVTSTIVPLVLPAAPKGHARTLVDRLLHAIGPHVNVRAAEATQAWRSDFRRCHEAFVAAAIARARLVLAELEGQATPTVQPDLFSRRAEREREQADARRKSQTTEALEQLALLELASPLTERAPELLLVLTP